jgi:hypothetical protein
MPLKQPGRHGKKDRPRGGGTHHRERVALKRWRRSHGIVGESTTPPKARGHALRVAITQKGRLRGA